MRERARFCCQCLLLQYNRVGFTQMKVTFCFYQFFFLSTALVLYSLGIFLSFGIRIKSVADAKKSRVYLFVLRWKFTKLLRKVKFHSYLLCWWNLFHSFFRVSCVFFIKRYYLSYLLCFCRVFTFWYTREHQLNRIEILVTQHMENTRIERERERACALDDGWLVGRWMCC